MKHRAPLLALALTALSVAAYVAYWVSRSQPAAYHAHPTAKRAPAAAPAPLPVRAREAPPTNAPPLTAPQPKLEEGLLMDELRQARTGDPERALVLAARANALFPNGEAAPERSWIVVRALEDLRRFHEARDAALAMRERYPGTSWTADVERHVLVYPLDQPSREAQQAAAAVSAP